MIKVRLIPSILLLEGRCVKGRQFGTFRDVGDPVKVAKVYDAQGADELIFLDVAATSEQRSTLVSIIGRAAEECFMPITVGGGVRTVDDFRGLLRAGADKIAINTEAVRRPELISEASARFGAQCVVVSIDVRMQAPGDYRVFVNRGREPTGLDAVEWARRAVEMGAGELLVTSIDREGTGQGFDLELVRTIADSVPVPVIAHGGAGSLVHLVEAIKDGQASAVSAATLFHFTDQSVIKARAFMRHAGLDVRLG